MTSTIDPTTAMPLPADQLTPAEPNFLGVPTEIRHRIYHFLFSGLAIKEASDSNLKRKRNTSHNKLTGCYKILPSNPWTILRTCKQVMEEVSAFAPVSPISYILDGILDFYQFPEIPARIRRRVQVVEAVNSEKFGLYWQSRGYIRPNGLPNLHMINLDAVQIVRFAEWGVSYSNGFYNRIEKNQVKTQVKRLYQHLEQHKSGDFILGDDISFDFIWIQDRELADQILELREKARTHDLVVSRPIKWIKDIRASEHLCLGTGTIVWDNGNLRITNISYVEASLDATPEETQPSNP